MGDPDWPGRSKQKEGTMKSILFLTIVICVAGLITAIMAWPRSKPKSHEMDSAEILKVLRGKS